MLESKPSGRAQSRFTEAYKEVDRETFFKAIGRENCFPQIVGKWPYMSVFKTPDGRVLGKSFHGSCMAPAAYYLPRNEGTT